MKALRKYIVTLSVLALGLTCVFLLSTSFKNTTIIDSATPVKHVVIINKMKFTPANLTVKKGDIVEWINKNFVPHDVTEINKKWTSKPMNQGDKFSKVITTDLKYFCSIHLVMKGSITVTDK